MPSPFHRSLPFPNKVFTMVAALALPLGCLLSACDPDTSMKKSPLPDSGVGLDRTPLGGLNPPMVADAGAPPTSDAGGPIFQPPPPPPPGGEALLKFCNNLTATSGPIELELRVGTQSWKAVSGQCSPAKGQPCAAVPAGKQAVALLRNGSPVWSDTIDIQAGVNVVAESGLDSNNKPVVSAASLSTAAACAAAGLSGTTMQPMPPPPPPPPPPGGQTAPAKFCHDLTRGGQDINLELVIGSARLKARTGSCSTTTAQACQTVPVGSFTASLTDGTTTVATLPVQISATGQYFFFGDIEAMKPVLKGGALKAGETCAAQDLGGGEMPPPPPPPPPPSGQALVKLCNALPGPLDVELVIAGVTLKAAQGQCTPVPGTPCRGIPAGNPAARVTAGGIPVAEGTVELAANEEAIFLVGWDEVAKKPKLKIGPPTAPSTCASFPK